MYSNMKWQTFATFFNSLINFGHWCHYSVSFHQFLLKLTYRGTLIHLLIYLII